MAWVKADKASLGIRICPLTICSEDFFRVWPLLFLFGPNFVLPENHGRAQGVRGGEHALALWNKSTCWPLVCLKGMRAIVRVVVPSEGARLIDGKAEWSVRVETLLSPVFVAGCSARWPMIEVVYCEFLLEAHALCSVKGVHCEQLAGSVTWVQSITTVEWPQVLELKPDSSRWPGKQGRRKDQTGHR